MDDEEPARQGLSEVVASWGYLTATAGDGRQAVERVESFAPHVVITDVVMPNLDGFKLLAHLRTEHPEVSVILLTGQGSVDAAIRSVKMKALLLLREPIEMRRLSWVDESGRIQRTRCLTTLRDSFAILAFGDMVVASDAMREV